MVIRDRVLAEENLMGRAGNGLVTLVPANLTRPQAEDGGVVVQEVEAALGQPLTVGKWPPAKRQSLVDGIVAEIAERIASGELKDGDVLPCQRDLARILGVSKTPLRGRA